jgi:ketosteroid isomerase-like protein
VSQENVERLRAGIEHFMTSGEPDWSALDEEVVVYDHDILDAGDYNGFDGYARWLEDFGSPWAEYTIAPEEYIDVGERRVVVVFQVTAIGAGSGIRVKRQDAMVCEMRNLKIVRIDYYNSREQALKAAGLEE